MTAPSLVRKKTGPILSRGRVWFILFCLAVIYFVVLYGLNPWRAPATSLASKSPPDQIVNPPQSVLMTGHEPPKVELVRPKLLLAGIVATPTDSFALIRTDNGPEMLYAVGQDIRVGVTLQAILPPNRALIRYSWGRETLILQGATSDTTSTVNNNRESEASTYATSHISGTLPKKLNHPARQALMSPNADGGLIVKKTRPGSLYREIGLRAGDIITSVNGQSVNSVDEMEKLYLQLRENKEIQVNFAIRRANENLILSK